MARSSLDFIDWMKAIGMTLIVVGHVAGSFVNDLTPPIYPKQLGVAFFLFAMGFSLARDSRPRWRVVGNRLFEVYLFGIAAAVVLTAIAFITSGAVYASNYLPFLGGINVVFNNFPVNPTTWYIGTYLHFLLLWAVVFRRVSITPSLLAGSIVFEMIARAILVGTLGGFVGYMMVPNWITVFLAGMWYGQRRDVESEASVPGLLTVVAALAIVWAVFVPAFVSERSIPFMQLGHGSDALTLAITSACVSFLYLSYTWLTFQITRCVRAPALVRVVARNTVIVFIAHMPVFYLLETRLGGWTTSRPLQAIIRLLVCFVALVIASEAIQRIVRPRALRDRILARASRGAAVPAEGAVAM
jgi:fucose 4-O-acetylase-like acetyltransferase